MQSFMERRNATRSPSRLTVLISGVTERHWRLHEEFLTRDLSSQGVFLNSDFLLAAGTAVKLLFLLPSYTPRGEEKKKFQFMATGKVIRAEKTGMAIIFDQEHLISPCPL